MLILVLLPLPVTAAIDIEAWDKLVWDFANFIHSFETGSWKGVSMYITAETKAGFGGEQGIEGVRQVYVKGNECFNDMLLALNQGCKKSSAGGVPACDAPPQWVDPSVIYLGARARFIFRQDEQRWVVDYLICGGD